MRIQEAATEAGVSEDSVQIAKKVKRDGVPELFAATKAGKLSLRAALYLAKLPAQEQSSALKKVFEAKKGKGKVNQVFVVAALAGLPVPRRKSPRRAVLNKLESRMVKESPRGDSFP